MTTVTSKASDPPAGPPWDLPLGEAPLLFIDLEMTGLDVEQHRVVQLCLQRVVGGELRAELSSLVALRDGEAMGNSHVHGITDEDLASAPTMAKLAPEAHRLVEGAILIAHAARWDISFLQAELGRHGIAWACDWFIDTLALSRRLQQAESHRLQALAGAMGIDSPHPHRADNDVAVTRALFGKLCALTDATTPRALWKLCKKGARKVSPEVMAAVESALSRRQPARVCYRPNGRPKQHLVFVATAIRSNLDPPVVLGYLQHTRGRRELRADRILTFEPLDDPV